jgi:hypothetical protein
MGHELPSDPSDVVHGDDVALRRRPETTGVETRESPPGLAQADHLPGGIRVEDPTTATSPAAADFGKV